jgi:glutathione-specific gamma-glutamylcyclotransferase
MNRPVKIAAGAAPEADAAPHARAALADEVFAHVPSLAGKIIDPERSRLRLSRASFQVWDEHARKAGYPDTWRRSHEEREALRREALRGRLDRDLWIFAYGSLMWDPAIHFAEVRRANLRGFHRRFCLELEIGRGSRARPGLMAALDHGGECHALAFRIAAPVVDRETEVLWMREMIREGYVPIFADIETPQGPIEALTFAIDRHSPRYADLSLDEAARLIATGAGLLGTNREYFDTLASHLDLLGIQDNVFDAVRARLPPIAAPADP